MTNAEPGRFCWFELATTDADAALAFYGALFGWTSEPKDMGEHGTYHELKLDGKDVGGLYGMSGPMFEGVPSHWMPYVRSADVDATAAKVTELGGKVLMPPMDIPDVGRMVVFADPQGAALSAFQEGKRCGTPLGDMDNHAFCWTELMTTDTAGAKAFYTKLFGWEIQDTDMGEMGTYTMWMKGDKHTGGCMQLPPEAGEAPPHWMNYVNVIDVNASLAKAMELGATTVVPVMPIPEVGQFTMIADPTGAHVCLFQHDPVAVGGKDCSGANS
ncbi:MAG: glyoxalase [Planctomycetota bacterium]|nr:MAG: glyoxalase [Planctomycetota bacterium]